MEDVVEYLSSTREHPTRANKRIKTEHADDKHDSALSPPSSVAYPSLASPEPSGDLPDEETIRDQLPAEETIREGMLTSQSMFYLELDKRELCIKRMGEGAKRFFEHAPFDSMLGQIFANFIHVKDQAIFDIDKPASRVRILRFFKIPAIKAEMIGQDAGRGGEEEKVRLPFFFSCVASALIAKAGILLRCSLAPRLLCISGVRCVPCLTALGMRHAAVFSSSLT